ncbi:MAG: MBL fold metallo-hydrolase [Aquificae bacterium]|nr:MBL fold metallo-hydrolase [Aquificota bacterium]
MEGFQVFSVGPLRVNSTVLHSGGEAFVFDPGGEAERIASFLRDRGLDLKGIFLTHGHVDHFAHAARLKRLFPDAFLAVHSADRFLLENELWPGFAAYLDAEVPPPVDLFLKEGDRFAVGSLTVEVLETPGHSPGSVVYSVPDLDLLIAGDLLFRGGVGRWDLPGGNLEELRRSLRRIFEEFDDRTRVVTGHYETTTLGRERRFNPHLRELGII